MKTAIEFDQEMQNRQNKLREVVEVFKTLSVSEIDYFIQVLRFQYKSRFLNNNSEIGSKIKKHIDETNKKYYLVSEISSIFDPLALGKSNIDSAMRFLGFKKCVRRIDDKSCRVWVKDNY